jgi:8-oxo-dGTP pyrophosphatase MutT (NUDIX family)
MTIKWPTDPEAAREWMRTRLASGPVDGWHEYLPPRHAFSDTRAAAVLLLLVWHPQQPTVLFTRRSDGLPTHPGQISFPGGKREAEDVDAVATALREAHEEIGLDPGEVEVLGTLPSMITVTRFQVVPVVGWIQPPLHLVAQAGEVSEIFEVPLSRVIQQDQYLQHVFQREDASGCYLSFCYRRHFIWGATAAMLRLLSLTIAAPAD